MSENIQVPKDQASLLDRLAWVLYQRFRPADPILDKRWEDEHPATQERWRYSADVVLRELGLRGETESYGMPDSDRHRYVTKWENGYAN